MAAAESKLVRALRQLRDDLVAAGIDFAVVGGLAVSARAEPRLTRDVDVAVATTDDAHAEAIVRRLLAAGYRVASTVEQTKTGRLATVRLTRGGVIADLLFATCGIENEIVRAAESLALVPRLELPVARTGHLIAMKLLSRDRDRPQDDDDARALLAVSTPGERRRAVHALALITRRGAARGRDLRRAWDQLVARAQRASETRR